MPTTNTTNTTDANFTLKDGTVIPTEYRAWLFVTEKGNCGWKLEDELQSKLDAEEIVWDDLPETQKDAYAWKKAYLACKEEDELSVKKDVLSKNISIVEAALAENAEALLAFNAIKTELKAMQKKSASKYSIKARLFGREKVKVGHKTLFNPKRMEDYAKLMAKGYAFDMRDGYMVVTKVPAKA